MRTARSPWVAAVTLGLCLALGYGASLAPSPAIVTVTPRPGTRARVETTHVVPPWQGEQPAIVINVPQRLLFLFAGAEARAFPVALGRPDWQTPLGEFQIVLREERPAWDVPVSIQEEMRQAGKPVITRMPPGPKNPLGSHWIGLSAGSVGIHGTPYPDSLSRLTTHGCIRVHPNDIPQVFAATQKGDRVQIVYEPILVTVSAGYVFVEAHPDAYRRARLDPLETVRRAVSVAAVPLSMNWDAVADALETREGAARLVGTVTSEY